MNAQMKSRYCLNCMAPIEEGNVCDKCAAEFAQYECLPHHLRPGMILKDRYIIGKVLGEGGFGITYIARDSVLDIKVAIKEFYMSGFVNRNNTVSARVSIGNGTTAETFVKNKDRFLSEARVLAKFADEEGIVGIRDFFLENDTAYIIMDFLEGITLKDYLTERGKISVEETANILQPIMNSLSKIHEYNIIHRDISPDNIMLLKNNKVKLLDFGAAREVLHADSRSLSVILKPGYAPNEQYRSRGSQGPWTDIYALCSTMYRCISGVTPDDSVERMYEDAVCPLSDMDCGCPIAVSNVIMKGMAVEPGDRYQRIEELKKDMEWAMREPENKEIASDVVSRGNHVHGARKNENSADEGRTEILLDNINRGDNQNQTQVLMPGMNENVAPQRSVSSGVQQQRKPGPKTVQVQPEQTANTRKKGSGKIILIIAIVLLALILLPIICGIGLVSCMVNRFDPSNLEQYEKEEIPEAFLSGSLIINDVTYKLPTTYAVMEENGWVFEKEEKELEKLAPEQEVSGTRLANGYGYIEVKFYNPTSNTLLLKDCVITELYVSDSSLNQNYMNAHENVAKTVDGFVIGTTMADEEEEAYGWKNVIDYTCAYETEDGKYSYVLYHSLDLLHSIRVHVKEIPEGYVIDEYSMEMPEWYNVEGEESFAVRAGVPDFVITNGEYRLGLGVMLDDYIRQGWKIDQAPEYIPSKGSGEVYIKYDSNNTLCVTVYNETDTALVPHYCLIEELSWGDFGTETDKSALYLESQQYNFRIDYGTELNGVLLQLNDDGFGYTENGLYYDVDFNDDGIYKEVRISNMSDSVYTVTIDAQDIIRQYLDTL